MEYLAQIWNGKTRTHNVPCDTLLEAELVAEGIADFVSGDLTLRIIHPPVEGEKTCCDRIISQKKSGDEWQTGRMGELTEVE